MRDGIQRLDSMCAAAAADGQPAIAITDHGTLGGAWKFHSAAVQAGIKPIFGVEAYLAIGSRFAPETLKWETQESKTQHYHHLTILAQTAVGWSNLSLMQHAAHRTPYRSHPLIDMDLLSEYSEGLIVLTGCITGPVLSPLAHGDLQMAKENLGRLREIFDPSHLWVEVMDHGIAVERSAASKLVEVADWAGLQLVATNDAHYTSPDQKDAHEAWLCAGQTNMTLQSPNRWVFSGDGYYLRTAAEMRSIFDDAGATTKAVDNSLIIASTIDDSVLPASKTRLPIFCTTDGKQVDSSRYLYSRVQEGARRRYGTPLSDAVKQRLRRELDVIDGAGLSDYFLIVEDMISWARSRGIRVGPGRGSAVGCCVAYCIGITDIDPLAHGLLFERFLNPERAGTPDIDTDFEVSRRDEVVAYLSERWGVDSVARIGTYGQLLAAAALRQAGRVTSQAAVGAKLAATVATGAGGKVLPLHEMLSDQSDAGAALRQAIASSEGAQEVVNLALELEGVVGNSSMHPCGVIVSDDPLPGMVPLRFDTKAGDAVAVSEWDGKDIENIGLLKLDVLGLRNLDVVTRCVQIIEETTGESIDPDSIDDDGDDERSMNAWKMIGRGGTAGVFQLESSGMQSLCMAIQPRNLDELAVIIALFRPGPLGAKMHEIYVTHKSGNEAIDYSHFTSDKMEAALIDSVLGETLGVPIFQEQLMTLGKVVAGFGPGETNRLQKAISKKVRSEMDIVGKLFVDGAKMDQHSDGSTKVAFSQQTADALWAAIAGAGDYSFNKSHALGYAKVAWITMVLKANWPAAFGAALLSVTKDDDKRAAVLRSLHNDGVVVLGPDVNRGRALTSIDADGAVRLGMAEIKGVRDLAARAIEDERQRGEFFSLADLIERVRVRADGADSKLDGGTVDALIEAGACDSMGPRMGLMMVSRAVFDDTTLDIPMIEWGIQERGVRECSRLGTILSQQPLVALSGEIAEWVSTLYDGRAVPIHKIDMSVDDVVTVGVVSQFDIIKRGKRRARLVLQGTHGGISCTIWSNGLARLEADGNLPMPGQVICVRGRPHVWRYERYADDDDSGEMSSIESVEVRELSLDSITISHFGFEDTHLDTVSIAPISFAA